MIAVASEHRIWISRDDGKTFALALQGTGSVSELFVEPSGRVYAWRFDIHDHHAADGAIHVQSENELGIADLDGRERWRELTDNMVPQVARDGWIAGLGVGLGAAGVEIGRNGGDSWSFVPGGEQWNPWLISLGDRGGVRFLASRMGKNDALDRGMSLLVARDGRRATAVWSMPSAGPPSMPSDETPCAGFAGSTLHLVVTDRKAGPSGTRLLSVGGDGAIRTRVLAHLVGGVVLDPGLTCEIAGNEHAAYLALDDVILRIDTREPRVSDHTSNELRAIAVDSHGDLLVLARRCVHRFHAASRREDELVCGPARS
ncbi:MAG: hypothetical protein E6J90_47890 [Deltaproteobacteria bacterium]|nr:MAG: hypothetical protein E6J90_47890 [Deltaproteobacteria bacterium]TMQ05999.1 MAG: hypothetical protein E6J91_39185 [Deltaproteobacteria bacterium]